MSESQGKFSGIVDPYKARSAQRFSGIVNPYQIPRAEEQSGGNTFTALAGGAKQTASALSSAVSAYAGDTQAVLDQSQAAAGIRKTQPQQEFMREVQERSAVADEGLLDAMKNVAASAWNNPQGAYHEMVAQLPNSAVAMSGMYVGAKTGAAVGAAGGPVGSVIGTVVGGIAGMFLANTAIETGNLAQSSASDGEVSDEDLSTARRQGAIKAGVITGVDAATMGISRVIAGAPGRAVEKAVTKTLIDSGVDVASDVAVRSALTAPDLLKKVTDAGTEALSAAMMSGERFARNAGSMAIESTGEGAGEFLGSTAAGMEASPTEAVMESMMSIPQSAGEIALAKTTVEPGQNTAIAEQVRSGVGINPEVNAPRGAAPNVDSAPIQSPPQAPESRRSATSEQIVEFAKRRLAALESAPALTESQEAEMAHLVSSGENAEALAARYKVDLIESQTPEVVPVAQTAPLGSATPIEAEMVDSAPEALPEASQESPVDQSEESPTDIDAPVLQNRDRATRASIEQMQKIAAKPDYALAGFSRLFSDGAPVVEPGVSVPAQNVGRNDVATTAEGRKIPVQYAVVEAAELVPSHRADGTRVPEYGQETVGLSRAIAGNGRIAGIQRAFEQGTATEYVEAMAQDEALHGVPASVIRQMQKPVLVRIMPKEEISSNIGDESNTRSTAILTPAEQAKSDARRIDVGGIEVSDDGEITAKSVLGFVMAMPQTERAGLLDDGKPNRQAHDRLNNLLFRQAFDSDELLRLQSEAVDPEVRSIMAALRLAAPRLARLRGTGVYDIRGLVEEAAETAVNAKRSGETLTSFIQQSDMARNPEIEPILRVMADNIRSAKRISESLIALADLFYNESQRADADMFGTVQKRSRAELMGELYGNTGGSSDATNNGKPSGAQLDGTSTERAEAERPELAGGSEVERNQQNRDTEQVAPEFELETQSEEDLQRLKVESEARQKQQADDAARAKADEQVSGFTLSGSNMPADVAASKGQRSLLDGINSAAHEAATSPKNDLPQPTDAQKQAGNYKMGHVSVQGMDITIENPKGSKRSGVDPDGKSWEVTMKSHYGYIKRTTGADGEQVDVFVGPDVQSDVVFVIDQMSPDKTFDEHKVMLGFKSREDAIAGYKANYTKDWRVGPVTTMPMPQFKQWLDTGDNTKPVSKEVIVRNKKADQKPKQMLFDGKTLQEHANDGYRKDLAAAGIDATGFNQKQLEDAMDRLQGIDTTKGTDGNAIQERKAKAAKLVKAVVPKSVDRAENFFRPGRIVKGFAGMDKVLSFERNTDVAWLGGWEVRVQEVDKNGNPIGRIRTHSTLPSKAELAAWEKDNPVPEPVKKRKSDPGTSTGALNAKSAASSEAVSVSGVSKIEDLGEKIGGARKDTAVSKGPTRSRTSEKKGWRSRYEITETVAGKYKGKFFISVKNSGPTRRPVGGWSASFDSFEKAEQALPALAVAEKHRPVSAKNAAGEAVFEIWRTITDRKRVKVVDQQFPDREAAMTYMIQNAEQIIETNTTFGEVDLPRPDNFNRVGVIRRQGDVVGQDFMEVFGLRAVEFGNWNNQIERQEVMNEAYDGLLDLADVLDISAKAIGLNGDLALAFGARGHGLNSARAHYELEKAVINLTKMNGAGALAHEWFHALDHYFGRQDGKASSKWTVDADGTRSLKVAGASDDMASHGFGRSSGVREELRQSYDTLMRTMFSKAETFVKDTQKADQFVAESREELAFALDNLRKELSSQKDPKFWKRKNKPASAEQLSEFDTIAKQFLAGELLETDARQNEGSRSKFSFRWTNDALDKISEIYKDVRGRSGFDATDRNGLMDRLRGYMKRYSERLKMLADAQQSPEGVRGTPTEFAMNAREMDQGRTSDYWTTPHEMAARAFQGYVEDRIAGKGGKSPFLNYAPESAVIPTPWGWKRPYPFGEERQILNQAFDNFVSVLQERETPAGTALFSRSTAGAKFRRDRSASRSTIPFDRAKALVGTITGRLKNAPEVIVVQSMQDAAIPDAVRREDAKQRSQGATGEPEGFYYQGKAYIVLEGLTKRRGETDALAIYRVFAHEVLGHAGLRGLFRDDLDKVLQEVAIRRWEDLRTKASEYGLDLTDREGRLAAAEEVLAEIAQMEPANSIVTKAVEAIRRALQRMFMALPTDLRNSLGGTGFADWVNGMSDAEIIDRFIVPAREFIRTGATSSSASAAPAFQRSANSLPQEIQALERDASELSARVNVAYESGNLDLAEELDARLEGIYDQLEAALEELQEDGVDVESDGYKTGSLRDETDAEGSLEDGLARDYFDLFVDSTHYRFDEDIASKVATLRDNFSFSRDADAAAAQVTDEQIIEAARDVYERKTKLSERRKSGSAIGNGGGFSGKDSDIRFSRSGSSILSQKTADFVDGIMSGRVSASNVIDLDGTPAVYQALGAGDLPLRLPGRVVKKAVDGKHSLTTEQLKDALSQIHDPVMVFDSATEPGAMVALTNVFDAEGRPVVAAIHLEKRDGRYEVNSMASIHGRSSAGHIKNWIEGGLLAYRHKQKSRSWLQSVTLQLRWEGVKNGSRGRVLLDNNVVNREQIRFSRSSVLQGTFQSEESSDFSFVTEREEGFSAPTETLTAIAIRKIQDKFKVLKDLQANIIAAGGTIDEASDAYLAEELFHGKAENDLRQLSEQYIEPLAKKMAKFAVTRLQLDRYLYARHAPERNAYIAEINPDMPDGGSGMTDAEAARIISEVRASGKREMYDQLSAIVYDIVSLQRDMIREGGLESDASMDAWQERYQNYVPLKGWAEDTKQEGRPGTGSGFNIRGRESRAAMGRSSKAASPVSFAIVDLTEKIIRRRKNEVGNALLKLVRDNPNKDYWEWFTDEKPDTDRRIVNEKDPATGEMVRRVRYVPVPMSMLPEKYFSTKIEGKVHYIKLKDDLLLRAMKNLGPESNNALIRAMATITRFMSALNTSYSPEFMVSNFARDVQTALLNLQAEQSLPAGKGKASGLDIAGAVLRDIPKAMHAIFASLRGKKLSGAGATWQMTFDQFREDGAKTGWFDMKDLDGQAQQLDGLVEMAQGGLKGGTIAFSLSVGKVVESLNQAVENAVRLSAYSNAIQAGLSRKAAASLAKNMTVNFNRRGEIGTTLNALYMFANASTQGVANFVRTMGTLKGDGSVKWSNLNNAQRISLGIVAGAYFVALANRAAAGDDDDGENWYDKVPDYVKERNIVLMKSLFGGPQDGSYWKIPLPYGFNVFYVLGDSIQSVVSGSKSAAQVATNVSLSVLGSFSPIGYQDSATVHGMLLKNAAPTVVKPLVELALNENFMGASIYNENLPFGTPAPESALGRRSTPEAYKALVQWMNEVSGGSEYRPGAVDVNPDVLQHVLDYFGGSAYSFFGSKVPDFLHRATVGVESEEGRVPFISRISGRVLPYEDTERFYQRRDEINQIREEYRSLSSAQKMQFDPADRLKLRLTGLLRQTENRLTLLRRQRDAVYSSDLSFAERDKKLKEVERKMKSVVDGFNKAYRE